MTREVNGLDDWYDWIGSLLRAERLTQGMKSPMIRPTMEDTGNGGDKQ